MPFASGMSRANRSHSTRMGSMLRRMNSWRVMAHCGHRAPRARCATAHNLRRPPMKMLAAMMVWVLLAGTASAQQAPVRVRGEVVSFNGSVLAVRTREAGEVKVELAPNGTVALRKRL